MSSTTAAGGSTSPAVSPGPVAARRAGGAAAVAWACLAGFAAIFGLVRAKQSEALDLALTLKLQRRDRPAVSALMRAVSWPGFPPQSRIIPVAIAGALAAARLRLEAGAFLLAWGTAPLATAVKALMLRPRPVAGTDLRVVAAPLGGSSFPSGHTITYVGLYGFLAYLAYALVRPAVLRRTLVGGLLGLVALVGPSRVQQGHHWFTDVTASYLLGIAYLIGVTSLYRRLKAGPSRWGSGG